MKGKNSQNNNKKPTCEYPRCTNYDCDKSHSHLTLYTEYISDTKYENLLTSKIVFTGKVIVKDGRSFRLESRDFGVPVFVSYSNLNRAFHNDEVGFEIVYPEEYTSTEQRENLIKHYLIKKKKEDDYQSLIEGLESLTLNKKSSSIKCTDSATIKGLETNQEEEEEEKKSDEEPSANVEKVHYPRLEGRVVYIKNSARSPIFGRLEPITYKDHYKLVPYLSRNTLPHDIVIAIQNNKQKLEETIYKVEVIDWPFERRIPMIKFQKMFDDFRPDSKFPNKNHVEINDLGEESIKEHPDDHFSEKQQGPSEEYWDRVIKMILEENQAYTSCSTPAMEQIKEIMSNRKNQINEEAKVRTDLRDIVVIAIDQKGTVSSDDALSIRTLPEKGCYELGIHITDVSYYVEGSTPLDNEALKNSINLYIHHRVFRMLPDEISIELGSITLGKDVLAFSLFLKVDEEGNLLEKTKVKNFEKTIIKSHCNLNYDEADEIYASSPEKATQLIKPKILEGTDPARVLETLNILKKIATGLNQQRRKKGVSDILLDRYEYLIDPSIKPNPPGFVSSSSVIQEMMLFTNTQVGDILHENCPELSFHKIVYIPSVAMSEKMNSFFESSLQFKNQPLRFDFSSPETVHSSFEKIMESDQLSEELKALIVIKFRYSQTRSEYGDGPGKSEVFSIRTSDFTSPMRKYFDLMVHRIMTYVINGKGQEMQKKKPEIDLRLKQYADSLLKNRNIQHFCERFDIYLHYSSLIEHPKTSYKEKAVVFDIRKDHITVLLQGPKVLHRLNFIRKKYGKYQIIDIGDGRWVLSQFFIPPEEFAKVEKQVFNKVIWKTKFESRIRILKLLDTIDVSISLQNIPEIECEWID